MLKAVRPDSRAQVLVGREGDQESRFIGGAGGLGTRAKAGVAAGDDAGCTGHHHTTKLNNPPNPTQHHK